MPTLKLVVGDWSGDGHEKTESYLIDTNLQSNEILDAYKEGCKVVGFDIRKEVADYEEDTITQEHVDMLKAHGINVELDEAWQNDEQFTVQPDDYVEIYLRVAKLGNPKLEFHFQEAETSLNIGGYGLFT